MRFRFIGDHREAFLVRVTCPVLRVSASGYHAWRGRPESARAQANRTLVEDTRRVHAGSRRRYGSPRVHASLQARGNLKGLPLGQAGGVQPCGAAHAHARHPGAPPSAVPQDHGQQPCFPACPEPAGPAVRVRGCAQPGLGKARALPGLADLTYIATGEGWLYLVAALDLFPRKIVGWAMSETTPQELTLAALNMAVTNRRPCPGLLHHSDRGSQPGFNRLSQRQPELIAARRRELRQASSSQGSCAVCH